MKTVFHKSGGRQMYQSAAPLIQEGINGKLPFFAGIHMGAGCASRFGVVCRGTAPHGFFYRPR